MSIRSKLLADAIRTIADEVEAEQHGRLPERVVVHVELVEREGAVGVAHHVEVRELATTAPMPPVPPALLN